MAQDSRSSGEKAFQIGLSFTGAVSAGAYSAGVLDFLIETLSEWQKAKDRGEPGVPRHEVFISTIAGASAGGVVGALGALSASTGVRPALHEGSGQGGGRHVLPELYDAWVKWPRLFSERADGRPCLLDTDDLAEAQSGKSDIVSLLNSNVLTRIARDSIGAVRPSGQRYPFFSEPMHLFLTLTNLDGAPYAIGEDSRVIVHGDRAHFEIRGLGSAPYPAECTWLESWGDQGMPLDVSAPLHEGAQREVAERLADAVLGTCAYPFGLAARPIRFRTGEHGARAWTIGKEYRDKFEELGGPIRPVWQDTSDTELQYVAVDGGATDNDALSLARYAIRDMTEQRNPREPELADRAVITIAPFPEPDPIDIKRLKEARKSDLTLWFVLRQFLPAMTQQARLKITDLLDAEDPDTFSRYIITPKNSGKSAGNRLACSAVSAFAGFLDEFFREHDFQLGRRNCQMFLRRHFLLHKSNQVFGTEVRSSTSDKRFHVEHPDRPNEGEEFRPIIPLVGSAWPDIQAPDWPKMNSKKLDLFQRRTEERITKLTDVLVDQLAVQNFSSHFWKWAIRRLWLRRQAEDAARRLRAIVGEQLKGSDQLS